MSKIFKTADILIPQGCDMKKWSVVACDQFSSQPEYWERLESEISGAPSTLYLMLPEAFLESRDQFEQAEKINAQMEKYIKDGVFTTIKNSYIYIERTLKDGSLRRGLIGALDLDEYDYGKASKTPVRATEGTVEDRLPPRVKVRSGASLEMPHIMVFVDDETDALMGTLSRQSQNLTKLYDFELCADGGHIKGFQVSGVAADAASDIIEGFSDKETLRSRYGDLAPAIFAMGDGNHSLATAKKCWEAIKPTLSAQEAREHPARYSLVELVNIHDAAVEFEPIHKVVFETEPQSFLQEAKAFWAAQNKDGACHTLKIITQNDCEEIEVCGLMIGELIGKAEDFCQSYMAKHGGKIDYIHNDETAIEMGARSGCAAILLPTLGKGELFPSIIKSGPFPKKSFSIGHAQDKRYYLECRKIK